MTRARKNEKSGKAAARVAKHRMVTMAIPPRESAYRVQPFTEKVIAMTVSADFALVFDRTCETPCQVAGKVGAAIKAAQRRDCDKQFIKRRINHHGRETYAVWRVK